MSTTHVERTKRNGPPPAPMAAPPSPPVQQELPDEPLSQAELAIRQAVGNLHRAIGERDKAENDLGNAMKLIAVNKIEIEGLRAEVESMRTRISSYQEERDHAVARFERLEGILSWIQNGLRTLNLPSSPVIRETAQPSTLPEYPSGAERLR